MQMILNVSTKTRETIPLSKTPKKIYINFYISNHLNFQIGYLQFYTQTLSCTDMVYVYKKLEIASFLGTVERYSNVLFP